MTLARKSLESRLARVANGEDPFGARLDDLESSPVAKEIYELGRVIAAAALLLAGERDAERAPHESVPFPHAAR